VILAYPTLGTVISDGTREEERIKRPEPAPIAMTLDEILGILKCYYRKNWIERLRLESDHPAVREHAEENRAYTRKMVTDAVSAGDWDGCLRNLPRGCRLSALVSPIQFLVADTDYWRHLGDLWTDTESPRQPRSWWLDLFSTRGEHLMNAAELVRHHALPAALRLYRGARPPTARGLGWNTDLAEAAWFAWRCRPQGSGRIYSVTVARTAIWACFGRRGRSELLIDPRLLGPLRAVHWTVDDIARMAQPAEGCPRKTWETGFVNNCHDKTSNAGDLARQPATDTQSPRLERGYSHQLRRRIP
jgi:hypothetical protein